MQKTLPDTPRAEQTKVNRRLSVHESSGNIVVTVTDEETGKVIREIPRRELLELGDRIQEVVGLVFDETV